MLVEGLRESTERVLSQLRQATRHEEEESMNGYHAQDGAGPDFAQSSTDGAENDHADSWPDPQPISSKAEDLAYPLDVFPESMRDAIEEVHQFVQSPLPLVGTSALTTLSAAAQALFNVQRAERLASPTSIWALSIAPSGERKTSTDKTVSEPVRLYDLQQAEKSEPLFKEYSAKLDLWNSEREGLLATIRAQSKNGPPPLVLRERLSKLQLNKPEPPRVPYLLHEDATSEALAWQLWKRWPSAAIMSSEGGAVLGSHSMGSDKMMKNLAQTNQLWDGQELRIERRTSESFVVRDARLTMSLQVQEDAIRNFLNRESDLARGMGWTARFLTCWPESTQGKRHFVEAPQGWPKLSLFHQRITALLQMPVALTEYGGLNPPCLTLSPEAKAAWVHFHDAIEKELGHGGEHCDVRDIASKCADNAARIAALFHAYDTYDDSLIISVKHLTAACSLAGWHLNEAKRFFGGFAVPQETLDLDLLDTWVIRYCRERKVSEIAVRELLRCGPRKVRRKSFLLQLLAELQRLHRIQLDTLCRTCRKMSPDHTKVNPFNNKENKPCRHCRQISDAKTVRVNPSLIGEVGL